MAGNFSYAFNYKIAQGFQGYSHFCKSLDMEEIKKKTNKNILLIAQNKNNFYEKYLIKSHLITPRKFFKDFKFLKYFSKLFVFRKSIIKSLLFEILKSIVRLPISTIKSINIL